MIKFSLWVDIKQTVWERSHITVEAETQEEAAKKALENAENGFEDCEFHESWDVDDSREQMSITDNGGESTIEIINPVHPFETLLTNELETK